MKRHLVLSLGLVVSLFVCLNAVDAKWSGKKYNHADKNDDGKISAKEYAKQKQYDHKKRSEVNTKWEEKADKNDDGYVDRKEKVGAGRTSYLKNNAAVNTKWEKTADANGDGAVDAAELKSYHTAKIDKNGDGTCDKAESAQYWLKHNSKANTAYEKKFDSDGNGYISGSEAQTMLKSRLATINAQGRAKVSTELEKQYDADSDGWISKSEAQAIKASLGE